MKQKFSRPIAVFCLSTLIALPSLGAAPFKNNKAAARPGYGGKLSVGDYVCTQDYFTGGVGQYQRRSDAKGTLSLQDGGTYKFRGSSGRYTYDEASGEIKWTSGYLSSDKNKSMFKRNQRTTQIDITFRTASGNLDWSCGRNN